MSEISFSRLLSYQQLNITPLEYEALASIRDQLSTGQISYYSMKELVEGKYDENRPDRLFNMDAFTSVVYAAGTDLNVEGDSGKWCGTAHCIGGWIKEILNIPDLDGLSLALRRELFYPDIDRDLWYHITPAQAVAAIDNFLSTGNPKWPSVTGAPQVPNVWSTGNAYDQSR